MQELGALLSAVLSGCTSQLMQHGYVSTLFACGDLVGDV